MLSPLLLHGLAHPTEQNMHIHHVTLLQVSWAHSQFIQPEKIQLTHA